MPDTRPTSEQLIIAKAALRIVVPYLLFAGAWILLSDRVLGALAPNLEQFRQFSILKGTFFVLASGTMLYLMLRRMVGTQRRAEHDKQDLLGREQAARAKAESASRAKDELLAIISHELRTPLTAILTSAEVLEQDPSLSDENRELAEMIRDNVLQESRIVADLLDCSSLASGKLELRLGRADVHQLIESVIREVHREAAMKQLSLKLELSASEPAANADSIRITQVLRNLLNNAIKFTPEAGVVTVRTQMAGEKVAIEVQDTGIGMTPEVRQRLFQQFEQGDRSVTRRFGGLGLGLFLARSIVDLHGGSLTASSPGTNAGSTFRMELPAWVENAPARLEQQVAASGCAEMTVLLIEDNIDTLRVLGRLLGRLGCTVMAARSGQEAIEIAGRERIDVIVSDIGLPDQTGWEVMRQLRQAQKVRGIAISGFDTEEDRQRSEEAGFDAHLVKPISYPALQAAVLEVAASKSKPEVNAPVAR